MASFQDSCIHRLKHRPPAFRPAGDEQRGLSQPIARIIRFRAEAAWVERCRELFERSRADRLRSDGRDAPLAQVKPGLFFGSDSLNAKIVSEIWPTTGVGPIFRDRPQPPGWPTQQHHRRHEHARCPVVNDLQNAADQAHVVIGWQPAHADAWAAVLESVVNQPLIVHQASMRHITPLGAAVDPEVY